LAQEINSGKIKLKVTGFRTTKGQLMVSFYSGPNGFPMQPDTVYRIEKSIIRNQILEYAFENFSYGTYAISLCDDETHNDTMNYTRLGIPTEGFGFSNNIVPKIKSPRFEQCMFKLNNSEITINIELIYKAKNHE